MTHPSAQRPDNDYRLGLLDADPGILEALYTEFRPAIIRAVSAAGGSGADGAVFFQLAVLEAAGQAHSGQLPDDSPIFFQLRDLALHHYADWLAERGHPEPPAVAPDAETQPSGEPLELPASDDLRLTRRKIFAWKCLERLGEPCREALLSAATDSGEQPANPAEGPCLEEWRSLLFISAAPADGPGEPALLPDWAEAARRDVAGYRLWRRVDELERRLAGGAPVQDTPRRRRRLPLLLGLLFAGLLGWGLYQWFFNSSSPAEVYRENFTTPPSILDDMRARYEADTSLDVVELPLECDALFAEADGYYREQDYSAASGPLTDLLADSLADCHSDAYYYLGLIALRLNEPDIALQFFSKIEDLENFGEDIYWYQSLAIVKMAARNPGLKEKARRAVERAVANSRNDERRRQAEEVLKQLSE